MLSIFYGDMPEAIYNPALFFKNTYADDWITDASLLDAEEVCSLNEPIYIHLDLLAIFLYGINKALRLPFHHDDIGDQIRISSVLIPPVPW